jgi:hypothetical protein
MPEKSKEPDKVDRQTVRGQSRQLPTSMLAKEFGKVYVRDDGPERHVEFTVWVQQLSGAQAEGWRTALAIDASASMKDWYGRNLTGTLPKGVIAEYKAKGWVFDRLDDGCRVTSFKKEAYEDAIARQHLKFTDNIIEPLVRDFVAYLATELDTEGRTTLVYWACGDGSAYEVVGDFSAAQCDRLKINGPKSVSFGTGTKLKPSMKYLVERFRDATQGMFVFITDGKLEDLPDVKRYTVDLATAVARKKRNPLKCILIGVGDDVDERQMVELDDLDTGTDIDIWDHKIAREMRALSEIMVELVDEVLDVSAVIYDASGQVVSRFTDGLPGNVSFVMPVSSDYFELEVGGRRIRQTVVV